MRANNTTLKAGTILATARAEYQLVDVLNNSGSFANIWLARVRKVYRRDALTYRGPLLYRDMGVAVKIPKLPAGVRVGAALKQGGWVSQLLKSGFVEQQALTQLNGLAVVPMLLDDTGTVRVLLGDTFARPSTVPFLVMELLSGQTLDQFLADHYVAPTSRFAGIPAASAFFSMAKRVARGLLRIHRRRVIHGDVWPRNIMICDQAIRFLDFGQSVNRALAPGVLQRVGSHPFLAPEGSGSIAGDVFGLGGTLFYLATGEYPPHGIQDENELKSAILARLRGVNPGLLVENRGIADIIARCLRYDTSRRLQTVDQVISDICLFETANRRPLMPKGATVRDYLLRDALCGFRAVRESLRQRGAWGVSRLDDQISTGMTKLLSFLRPGDSYHTLSTIKFWLQGNMGYDGRFLSMNVVKAVQGIKIERVFLLKHSDLESDEGRAVLMAQIGAFKEIRSATGNFDAKEPWYEIRYVLLPDQEYTEALLTYQHGGLMFAGGVGAVVMHTYSAQNRIIDSQLDHNNGHLFRCQRRAFDEHKAKSLPLIDLEDFLLKGPMATPDPRAKPAA